MKNLILALIAFLSFVSCRNDTEKESKLVPPVNVYVSGYDNYKACYWKNGTKIELSGGDSIRATKIVLGNNGDVHVLGKGFNNFFYWKNNVKHDVAQLLGVQPNTFPLWNQLHIFDMAVINNDVYFVGETRIIGTVNYQYGYWKNGTFTALIPLNGSSANNKFENYAIAKHQNDLYVLSENGPNNVGHCFKNGTWLLLGDDEIPTGIASNNTSIYVSMNDNITATPTYKYRSPAGNTVIHHDNVYKKRVFLDGNDIYSLGEGNGYVKNGVQVTLNDPSGFNSVNDMKVKNGNVYSIRNSGLTAAAKKVFINDTETLSVAPSAGELHYIFID